MKFQKHYKPVTKNFWKYIHYLPKFIREKIIRSQFEINYNLSSDYVLKQAETKEEIQEALKIVYDSYTLLGYIDKREEKIHFNAFLCLPTTTILIIKCKDEVIGTMSIVMDSAFGLPSEKTWNIDKIRQKCKSIAEISSLSIKKNHKSTKGHLLFALCKLMYQYCVENLDLDGILISATQEVEPFYTDLLLFETVSRSGIEHSYVKGNKSTCCFLDFNESKKKYLKVYNSLNKSHNLAHFFLEYNCPNIHLPKKQLSIQGILLEKNKAMLSMLAQFPSLSILFSSSDKLTLSNLDPSGLIERAINFDSEQSTRVFPRVSIKRINCFVYHPKTKAMIAADLTDISKLGFGVQISHQDFEFKQHDAFELFFQFEGEAVNISSELRWNSQDKFGYFVLEKSRKDWERFVNLVLKEVGLTIHDRRKIAAVKAA